MAGPVAANGREAGPGPVVIGIDPGTRHLGWGLVRGDGARAVHVAHGVVDTDDRAPLGDRLCQIERELGAVVAAHRPGAAAVETVFFHRDATAAAKLGHARGVALLVLARAGVPVFEYPPARVKRAVVGRGAADKRQVAMVVGAVLGLRGPLRPDAADALALAIVHLRAAPVAERIARSIRRPAY